MEDQRSEEFFGYPWKKVLEEQIHQMTKDQDTLIEALVVARRAYGENLTRNDVLCDLKDEELISKGQCVRLMGVPAADYWDILIARRHARKESF